MSRPTKYPRELRERAVRMVPERRDEVMVVGGGEPSTPRAQLGGAHRRLGVSPAGSWVRHSLQKQRWHVNAVLLPDSSVFVSGGMPTCQLALPPL